MSDRIINWVKTQYSRLFVCLSVCLFVCTFLSFNAPRTNDSAVQNGTLLASWIINSIFICSNNTIPWYLGTWGLVLAACWLVLGVPRRFSGIWTIGLRELWEWNGNTNKTCACIPWTKSIQSNSINSIHWLICNHSSIDNNTNNWDINQSVNQSNITKWNLRRRYIYLFLKVAPLFITSCTELTRINTPQSRRPRIICSSVVGIWGKKQQGPYIIIECRFFPGISVLILCYFLLFVSKKINPEEYPSFEILQTTSYHKHKRGGTI